MPNSCPRRREEMKNKFLLSTVLVLTIVLAACAPKAAPPSNKTTPPTSKPLVTQPTTAPTKIGNTSPTRAPTTAAPKPAPATPTPGAPQATGITPTVGPALFNDISVDNQSVSSGSVLVSMVDSLQPGWVAIFTDNNGQPGNLLGYAAVPAGTSSDVKVTIDSKAATDKMIAMLLIDAGKIGTFEYPGADTPVKNNNISTSVMAIFNRVKGSS